MANFTVEENPPAGEVSLAALNAALATPRIPNGCYLIHEAHIHAIGDALAVQERLANTRMRGEPSSDHWGYRVENRTALIPVMGTLISRGNFVGPMYGVTSYEGLRSEIRRASTDPKVDKITLAIDSPGGTVSGIDAVGEEIKLARTKKPVVAHVEGMAASAAYWIASQADSIIMTPMSEVGSIGVVSMHMDVSQALKKVGINVTPIYSGKHKVDGNPYEPLPDDVKKAWQADVDGLRAKFADAVATGRKQKCTAEDMLATEAGMFSSDDAISKKMADYTGSLDAVVAAPAAFFGFGGMSAEAATKGHEMNLNEAVAAANPASTAPVVAAPASAPVAAAPAVDQKARIREIMQSAEAEGRKALAEHFAFNTDMDAASAIAALSVAPREASSAPAVPSVAQRAGSVPHVTGAVATPDDKGPLAKENLAAIWDRAAKAYNRRQGFES
jgi:capsid assembly protease